MNTVALQFKVADETWVAAALLHREHPDAEDFTVADIVERAAIEGFVRRSVYVHANSHCVANRPPNPGAYRMLYETAPDRRRLFRDKDHAHPRREGKTSPRRDQIPDQYRYLLDWYDTEYAHGRKEDWLSGVFEMSGAAKDLYSAENPDDYVRRLREGWV